MVYLVFLLFSFINMTRKAIIDDLQFRTLGNEKNLMYFIE
jgi:hypothetical protein